MRSFFLKKRNSVLPILVEKNFEQKIYFCLLKIRCIFLKKRNSIFSIDLEQRLLKSFSRLHVKKFKIFVFILFEKRRLAQGIRRPKGADSPLYRIDNVSAVSFHLLNAYALPSFRLNKYFSEHLTLFAGKKSHTLIG